MAHVRRCPLLLSSASSSVSLTPSNMMSSVSLPLNFISLSKHFLQTSMLTRKLHRAQNSFLKAMPWSVQKVDIRSPSHASTTAEPFPYPYDVLISSENVGLEHKSLRIIINKTSQIRSSLKVPTYQMAMYSAQNVCQRAVTSPRVRPKNRKIYHFRYVPMA